MGQDLGHQSRGVVEWDDQTARVVFELAAGEPR
jgi:hypothetical protein